jgi:protein-S-isoprenylcysteine O-methyltransferase Ste14
VPGALGTIMTIENRLTDVLYRWRVRASLISVIAAFVLARPNRLSLLAGSGFIILGLLLRGWACGHLTKDRDLTISGPYRYTRNPLYLGSLLIGIGVTAASRSWWVAGLFALNFLIFYPVTIRREKEVLLEAFPEAYRAFSRSVPLFFPGWKPNPQASTDPFTWRLYKKNKEYRALWGALIFVALLCLKMVLWS